MDNKIFNMEMTNFQPESRGMAITFEILVQNR